MRSWRCCRARLRLPNICKPDVAEKKPHIFICAGWGYVMIARNYRGPRSRSELDLVGWDGDALCFIEVKTRTTRAVAPAEAAVDGAKQRDLSQVARDFLRKVAGRPPFRFDIVSIYFEQNRDPDISVFKDAFRMS